MEDTQNPKPNPNEPRCELCGHFAFAMAPFMRFVAVPIGRQTRRILTCPDCTAHELSEMLHTAPQEILSSWYQEKVVTGTTRPIEKAPSKKTSKKESAGLLTSAGGSNTRGKSGSRVST